MLNDIEFVVEKLKKDTNNIGSIVYRKKYVHKKKLYIIYNEPLVSSDKISDFIVRSLNKISVDRFSSKKLLSKLENDISNFKVKVINKPYITVKKASGQSPLDALKEALDLLYQAKKEEKDDKNEI